MKRNYFAVLVVMLGMLCAAPRVHALPNDGGGSETGGWWIATCMALGWCDGDGQWIAGNRDPGSGAGGGECYPCEYDCGSGPNGRNFTCRGEDCGSGCGGGGG